MKLIEKRKIRLFKPAGLDFRALLPADSIWLEAKHLINLHWFIHIILSSYKRRKVITGRYVQIPRTLLKARYGTPYKSIVDQLEKLGVIKPNPHYRAGEEGFSKSYKLCEPYRTQPIVNFYVLVSGKIKVKDKTNLKDEIQKFIFDNLSLLTLDTKAFSASPCRSGMSLDAYNMALGSIVSFSERKFQVRSGKNQKRIYHLLTDCPAQLRAFFNLNGEPLVEADVRAAQPTLLLSLYDDLNCEEANKFRQILDGDFYNYFRGNLTRKQSKKHFLWFAFGKRSRVLNFKGRFEAALPILFSKIQGIPGGVLARMLQNLESEIVNYSVLEQCRQEGIFALSVHDGFVCEARYTVYLAELLKAECQRRLNYTPEITFQDYSEPYPYQERTISNKKQEK